MLGREYRCCAPVYQCAHSSPPGGENCDGGKYYDEGENIDGGENYDGGNIMMEGKIKNVGKIMMEWNGENSFQL